MLVSETSDLRKIDSVPLGNSTHITKLVECPVVLSMPARSSSLYTGQWYTPLSVMGRSYTGCKCKTGI